MTSTTNNRQHWIDAVRGMGIILVLMGHNNPTFINIIFAFHMPLFFILSGYLYKSESMGILEYGLKLVWQYIVPYYVLGLFNLILHIVHLFLVIPEHSVPMETVYEYIRGILIVRTESMPCCAPLWFVPCLAVTMFILHVIHKIKLLPLRLAAVLLCCILGSLCVGRGLEDFYYKIPVAFVAVAFAEIGSLLKHFNVLGRLSLNYVISALSILITTVLGFAVFKMNVMNNWPDMSAMRYGNVALFVISASLITVGIMIIFIILEKVCGYSPLVKTLAYIGKHTLFFLAFDASTNAWTATVMQMFIPSWEWYVGFVCRVCMMAVYFMIWQGLLKIIKAEKVVRFLDF